MHPLPHRYDVVARGGPTGLLSIEAANLPTLEATAPPQFGGPGNVWSPEALLVAAVASCFILTFDTIAELSRLPWIEIACPTEGILELADGKRRFTRFFLRPTLQLPKGADAKKAEHLLHKAEEHCLITASLSSSVSLSASLEFADGSAS
ncbi:OsmC family protein [Methylacidimicrobium sp. B4]|uniref:OsmC family protein n=1 Tax=Methylacidimicrobium sp. B4 TaxID=2796139 RepID=UPI001A8D826F|nr:OsmC family protein [Methylacidimicrobium sp. B4]QSR84591.1 OsmC family protein [Methylacidimicrobium sp. B4]